MPLSPEEQQQLKSLMEKAAASGEMPAFEGWTHLSVEAAANSGAMTDGSKRREDSYAEEPILKRVHVLESSGSEADPSRLVSHAGYAAVESFSSPFVSETHIELPPNVPTLREWGRTVIEFGKLSGTNLSYAELFERTDEHAQSYKKWLKARVMTGSAQLQDLARYLVEREKVSQRPVSKQGPVIPGTSLVRKYK